MIAGIITMGLGETTEIYNNPSFIGPIDAVMSEMEELTLEIQNQELSLIID